MTAPTASRTLLLLRHADAEQVGGGRDRDRPLSAHGRDQAAAVGQVLRAAGLLPDRVLCSPSLRTRQTLEGLGLPGLDPASERVELADAVYEAGSDTLLELVRALPADVRTALVVGHAPGVPQLALDLAGPGSDAELLGQLERRFPTATLARITVEGAWSHLDQGQLTFLRFG